MCIDLHETCIGAACRTFCDRDQDFLFMKICLYRLAALKKGPWSLQWYDNLCSFNFALYIASSKISLIAQFSTNWGDYLLILFWTRSLYRSVQVVSCGQTSLLYRLYESESYPFSRKTLLGVGYKITSCLTSVFFFSDVLRPRILEGSRFTPHYLIIYREIYRTRGNFRGM